LREGLLRLRRDFGTRYGDRVEAERHGLLCKGGLDAGRGGQKSRSA
jgi:hypothetical protein